MRGGEAGGGSGRGEVAGGGGVGGRAAWSCYLFQICTTLNRLVYLQIFHASLITFLKLQEPLL